MKVLLLLVAVVALGQAKPMKPHSVTREQAEGFCSLVEDAQRAVSYYRDPINCHAYFLCVFHPLDPSQLLSGHHFSCAPGTHWNQRILACAMGDKAEICDADPCEDPVVKKVGFYPPAEKENCRSFMQCDNGMSVKRCCPAGQVFDAHLKQCVQSDTCSDLCAEAEPEDEDKSEKSDEFEKGKVYTCTQGDYTFTVVNTKSYKRVGPDGAEIEQYCPEETPYFSYSRCTCYSKDDMPERDLTPPEGVVLSADQCYRDGMIYTKTGDITYFTNSVDAGVSSLDIKTCPSFKLFFRLSLCDCDVFTVQDSLAENECIMGSHIYQQVDEHSYKMATLADRDFGDRVYRCVTRTPLWNKDQCYCDIDPNANEGPVVPSDTCNAYDMTTGRLGDTYVQVMGGVTIDNGEACFTGDGQLDIPTYSANTLGNQVTIAFRFKYSKWGTYPMAPLVHNGQTVDISTSDSEVKVTLSVGGQQCSVAVPNLHAVTRERNPPPPEYDYVLVQFDGTLASDNLKLRVLDNRATADCQGSVDVSVNPITMGNSGFVGCMDDLYICKEIKDPFAVVTPFRR